MLPHIDRLIVARPGYCVPLGDLEPNRVFWRGRDRFPLGAESVVWRPVRVGDPIYRLKTRGSMTPSHQSIPPRG